MIPLYYSDGITIKAEQLPVNGWEISYNPDDDRFYVEFRVHPYNDVHVAYTFGSSQRKDHHIKSLSNARNWATTHNVAEYIANPEMVKLPVPRGKIV